MRFGFAGIIAVGFLALEMVGIFLIGQEIGVWRTLLWLLTSAVVGMAVISREGSAFMPRLAEVLHQGGSPFPLLWHSGRRLVAGLLLIFPGLVSDLVAILLLLWPSPPGPPRREDGAIEGEFRRED